MVVRVWDDGRQEAKLGHTSVRYMLCTIGEFYRQSGLAVGGVGREGGGSLSLSLSLFRYATSRSDSVGGINSVGHHEFFLSLSLSLSLYYIL